MTLASRIPTSLLLATLASTACLTVSGCKGDDGGEGDESGTGDTLYERLGGAEGINDAVTDLVVDRIAPDAKINAYFLNSGVDVGIVINCLSEQLGSLTGGPETYPNANCRDMKSSHEGLGISDADFMDLAGHLVAELQERGVAQDDIDTIVAALTGMYDDIVEDPSNNATVYQRVSRYPAIALVVTDFYGLVLADTTLQPYFAGTDQARFEACLSRQVCGIDGPCVYGEEAVALDPTFGMNPCANMVDAHAGLGITIEDFGALAGHLVTAMGNAGIAQDDQDAILGVLGPLCAEIVADPATCP